MTQTRRTFLKFFGGATLGVVFSPLPWKLLDDAAIWTQNSSSIARPPRGPVSWAHSTCTLCPAACGLRLRLIGGSPVSAWAVPGHPVSDGCVCPTGLGAAQVRFHPARIRHAVRRVTGHEPGHHWQRTDPDEAVATVGRKLHQIREADRADRVALLDLRPGRSLSLLYHDFLDRAGGGRYLTLPDGHDQAANSLAALVECPGVVPGIAFSGADAVISFGAALCDGWLGAGPAPGLRRADGSAPYLVQVETNASITAGRADRWVPLRPGTETALALGLANLILQEGKPGVAYRDQIVDLETAGTTPGYRDLVRQFSPTRVAELTGCRPRVLTDIARQLMRRRGALAVGGGDPGGGPLGREEEAAIWGLNLLLGAVGDAGRIPLRRDLTTIIGEPTPPPADSPWDVPDGSLELLFIDGANPGMALSPALLRRKLAPGGLAVGLSAFTTGPAAAADLIFPVPAPGEWVDDVPGPALAPRTTYALARQIATPPKNAPHPIDLLDRVAAAAGLPPAGKSGAGRHADHLRRRTAALHTRGRGEVFTVADQSPVSVPSLLTSGKLAQLLADGGCWSERPDATLGTRPIRLLGAGGELAARFLDLAAGRGHSDQSRKRPLTLMLHGQPDGVLPPVANKLYRESNLKPMARQAHVNPATARAHHLHDGHAADLVTAHGRVTVTVVLDEAVMPGVVRMAAGPDPVSLGDPDDGRPDVLLICDASHGPVWRVGSAALLEVHHG